MLKNAGKKQMAFSTPSSSKNVRKTIDEKTNKTLRVYSESSSVDSSVKRNCSSAIFSKKKTAKNLITEMESAKNSTKGIIY
jgi:uncharacterized membrane protein